MTGFLSSLRQALRRARRRPLRSLLLLVQVVFGTLAVTLALSAYLGAQPDAPLERFSLIAGSEDPDGSSTWYQLFQADDLPELLDLAPDVAQAALFEDAYGTEVVVGDRVYAFRGGARVSADYFAMSDLELTQGSFFTADETQVALLSDDAARSLFGDADPVGQTLGLRDPFAEEGAPPTPTQVIGTFAEAPDAASFFGGQPVLYLPFGPSEGYPQASRLEVLAAPGQGEAARAQVLAAARSLYEDELRAQGTAEGSDFIIKAPGEEVGGFDSGAADLVLFGLFGAVALIVSAVGLFSVSLSDTAERSFEVGLKRALGASRARVSLEVMLGAVALALLGALLGVLLAALLVPLLAGPAQDAYLLGGRALSFEPLAALIALSVMVVASGLLSLAPALRSSRQRPAAALKEVM